VLFVCKLNPITRDEDLELIFSRFGPVVTAQVIRDQKSGDSLQYAFVEFENQSSCEEAYLKMDNVLIDDRRIHVDFSQSVSKLQAEWRGGREDSLRKQGIQLKKKYRDQVDDKYQLVFDHDDGTNARLIIANATTRNKKGKEQQQSTAAVCGPRRQVVCSRIP